MKFTQEQIEEIEQLAGVGYTVRQIAMYFDINWGDLHAEYLISDSEFRYHFDRGILLTRAKIDISNVKLAQGGNMTAVALVNKALRSSKYQQLKQNIFNDKY